MEVEKDSSLSTDKTVQEKLIGYLMVFLEFEKPDSVL